MIQQADVTHARTIAELACLLWPDHMPEELIGEFAELLENKHAAVFIAEENDQPVGFAQCQLRSDYVEGCDTSPVGYLEGVFVREDFRRHGLARALVHACEDWARQQGCSEFASDCELDNIDSWRFHQAIGFTEAGRIICFTKRL